MSLDRDRELTNEMAVPRRLSPTEPLWITGVGDKSDLRAHTDFDPSGMLIPVDCRIREALRMNVPLQRQRRAYGDILEHENYHEACYVYNIARRHVQARR